ncbi:hypothetical protein RUM43_013343 [Polyplax serrata]|uniref:Uncharacterized protein n=1 Tax=Polyplax serrata TaxID=468196 RepID=A0AAN8Q2N6_POLSC
MKLFREFFFQDYIMDKGSTCNEGEMGSGESDDEFYNVKLPCTPTVTTGNISEKPKVKKVYSPSRMKVKYDYKFDSSSDDESDNGNQKESAKIPDPKAGESSNCLRNTSKDDCLTEEQDESLKENSNLPKETCEVVERINEELKNMKNTDLKAVSDRAESETQSQTHVTSVPAAGNAQRSQIGVVSPVVVVPPPLVVPTTPIMNMGPMIVPGMGGQNMVPRQMVGMAGNLLQGPSSMGSLITSPSGALPGGMVGMNAMQSHIAGMIGMQGNIIGLPGNTISTQGNIMGLQSGMINQMGGMNMAVQGNVMGIPAPSVMGMQGSTNIMGIPRPNLPMARAMGVSGTPSTILGMQTSGTGIVSNNMGIGNSMVGSSPSLMVVGGVMSNMANQSAVASQGNMLVNNNIVRVVGASQSNSPVRPVPPPPFLNLRNRPPLPVAPGNFQWQGGTRLPGSISGSSPSFKASIPSPAETGSGQYNCEELYKDEKDESPSDTDESQSPTHRELPNTFKNDGSFMEMFKRMKDEKNLEASSVDKPGDSKEAATSLKKSPVILSGIVGKRRGGRVLKTGLVKKVKKESETEEEKHPKDAWSMYMAEVKKYREASCEEEGKTRPLVK